MAPTAPEAPRSLELPEAGEIERVNRNSEEATLQVLMVTDLVAFTSLLVKLGDDQAQQLMRWHNSIVRNCLRAHQGREVTHTGDGVLASFRSVRRALRCALEIQAALQEPSAVAKANALKVRIGLHVGEPLPEDGRLFGRCVNVAVRICEAASCGGILASELVRLIAQGHGVKFVERGVFQLKGLNSAARLYEVHSPSEIAHITAAVSAAAELEAPALRWYAS